MRGHCRDESSRTIEWPTSAGLDRDNSEPEVLRRETKSFLHCWRASGDRSSQTKIPFTSKCLRLKQLARTRRWSQSEASLRTMGLGRERVGSPGSGFLNLPMWNISVTGVGRTVKNSNIFFTETIVSGKDFVSLILNTIRFSCQLGGEVLRALGLELEVETEGGDPPLSTVVSPDWDGRGGEDGRADVVKWMCYQIFMPVLIWMMWYGHLLCFYFHSCQIRQFAKLKMGIEVSISGHRILISH